MTQVSPELTGVLEAALETADLLAAHADGDLSGHIRAQAAAERRARLAAAWDAAVAANDAVVAARAVTAEIWAAWRPQGEISSAYQAWQAGRDDGMPDQPVAELAILVATAKLTDPTAPFFHAARPGFDLKPAVVDAANTGYRHPGIDTLHRLAVAALAATGERVAEIGLDHLIAISDWELWRISGGALDPVFQAWRDDYQAEYRPPAIAVGSTIATPNVRPSPPTGATVLRGAPTSGGTAAALYIDPPRAVDGVTHVEATYRVRVTTRPGATIPGNTKTRRITDGSACPAAVGDETLTESTETLTDTTTRTTCLITTAEIPATDPVIRRSTTGGGPCPAPRTGETLTGDDLQTSGSTTTACVYRTLRIPGTPGTPGRDASTRVETTTGAACPAAGSGERLQSSEVSNSYNWACTVRTRGRQRRTWITRTSGPCSRQNGAGLLASSTTSYTCFYSQTGVGSYSTSSRTPCPRTGSRPRSVLTRQTQQSVCTYEISAIAPTSTITRGTVYASGALALARQRCNVLGAPADRSSSFGSSTQTSRRCVYETPAVAPVPGTPEVPARSWTVNVAGGASNCPAAPAGATLTPSTSSTRSSVRYCAFTKPGRARVPAKVETVTVDGDVSECPAAKSGQTVVGTPAVSTTSTTVKICTYTTPPRVSTTGGSRYITYATQPVPYPDTAAEWAAILDLNVFTESELAGTVQVRYRNAAGLSGDLVVAVDPGVAAVERAAKPVWGAQGTDKIIAAGYQFKGTGGNRSVNLKLYEMTATPTQIGATARLLPTTPHARIVIPPAVLGRRNQIQARYETATGARLATHTLNPIPLPFPTDVTITP